MSSPTPRVPVLLNDALSDISVYSSATTRLLIFDYDGTLTPIVNDPSQALLSPLDRQTLDGLAKNAKNRVCTSFSSVFLSPLHFGYAVHSYKMRDNPLPYIPIALIHSQTLFLSKIAQLIRPRAIGMGREWARPEFPFPDLP